MTTWTGKHKVIVDKPIQSQQRALVQKMLGTGGNVKLKLVRREVLVCGHPYLHYGVTDGTLLIEFGDGQMAPQQVRVLVGGCGAGKLAIKEFELTSEVMSRINQVCGATNYSLVLRNSEHLARYIQCGTWCSLQMTGSSQTLTRLFSSMGEHQAFVNTLPEDLVPDGEGPAEAPILFPQRQPPRHAEPRNCMVYKWKKYSQIKLGPEAYNVALLGPTGAGKSTIINHLFNRQVALVKGSPQSVTRQMTVYSGHRTSMSNREVNVLDTIGFCDSALPADEVVRLVQQFVETQFPKLDKVIVVTSGRIEADHARAIRTFMDWLDYERHKTRFIFIYNKAEDLQEGEKTQAVSEMCAALNADPDAVVTIPPAGGGSQERRGSWLPCAVGVPSEDRDGSEDVSWQELQKGIPCVFAAGFPRRAQFKDVSEDLSLLIQAVFPEAQEGTRIEADLRRCQIL